ncbi:MAG: 16S rRNA (guanine(527)-N(7))-methyltransferase RsmG [Phycisphaerales bacterium]
MTKPSPHSEPLLNLDDSITALTPPPEFVERARELGVEFEEGDVERLGLYLAILLRANERLNLTAITDPAAAWNRHILDSLTLVPILAQVAQDGAPEGPESGSSGGIRVIDVGTGGGVPGMPLAVVLPRIHMTLLEATGKKAQFLTEAVRRLGLSNTSVVCERAERAGQDHRAHRERYDVAIARALGPMAVLTELTAPLVKPGGFVLAVKGARAADELEEAKKAMGLLGVRHVQTIDTPTGKIVVLEKTTRTPRLYPRRDGEPKRSPLGVDKRSTREG